MFRSIREIFQYKEMIASLVRQSLRTRYRGSFLGFLWTFVNPLMQLVVYSIVFSVVMRIEIDNFAMYLFIGLIPWIFFANALRESSVCILNNDNLIKKIYFPRAVLPVSVVLAGFINMMLGFVIVIAMLLLTGLGLSLEIVYLPVVLAVELVLSTGIALWVSSLTVYFRDLEHMLEVVTMVWFYLTPIVYNVELIPERWQPLFRLNPMYALIQEYRNVLFFQTGLDAGNLVYPAVLSVLLLFSGVLVFEKLQRNFAEEI
ncbi:MAG: ABC transporter permease [Anaerolineales bacterium]|nr:ABC transporter permease [Anaerolineales bacterium]